VLLLHPQQTNAFTEILTRKGIKVFRDKEKKDSKKLAQLENAFYICTPQNAEVH